MRVIKLKIQLQGKNCHKLTFIRINTESLLLLMLSKIFYIALAVYGYGSDVVIFKTIILLIFSGTVLYKHLTSRAYTHRTTQLLNECLAALFFWTNIVLLLGILFEKSKFSGALELYLLGIPIVCVIVVTKKDTRLKLLLLNDFLVEKGEIFQRRNLYYLHIIENRENRTEGIILKGYINNHIQICPYDGCPIKEYKI